jgi:hypothetical protein
VYRYLITVAPRSKEMVISGLEPVS